MNIKFLGSNIWEKLVIIVFLVLLPHSLLLAQTTKVQGIVRDSVSGEAVEFATIRFDGTSVGKLTDENGKFSMTNSGRQNKIVVSLMGYTTKEITVPVGQTTQLDIKLKAEGVQLKQIVIKPGKEKYSKKDNPAVALIKKVIEHKHEYLITNQNYYMNDEYDRILFAFNEYKPDKGLLKSMKFLAKYADSSLIDNKPILPFSVRETTSNVYYRKNPKANRRVVTAYQNEGIDQDMDTEAIDAVIEQVFTEVNITDNNINLLFHDFVSPLSSVSSVNFYKWYIIDTVAIDNSKYINLGFVPFNTRDVGFIGNIYVKADSTYAIKKVSFRVPSKINVNFVNEMIITQEFKELSPNLWIPEKFTMAIDMTMYGVTKFYVQKERNFSNFLFDLPVDAVFNNPSPVIYLGDYKKHDSEFWDKQRPKELNKDFRMDKMVEEFRQNKLIDFAFKAANALITNYIPLNGDDEKNKLDIGTTVTFYSYNPLEGNRFRLTGATTSHFHKHLFLYGYGAYGTRDNKFKYYGELTWAFNKRNYHKDEYPKHNLSIGYKYDVNALGQKFLQAERDNIFLSMNPKKYDNLTYAHMAEISYIKENYNGFSSSFYGRMIDQKPAGALKFELKDVNGNLTELRNFKTTEFGVNLRYAPDEKFFQQRRRRVPMPSKNVILSFSHSMGVKDFLGGQYNYHISSLGIEKEFWIAPFGKLAATVRGEKVWGKAPFPLLLSANANSSSTIQRGSFYMLRPLEFMNDSQVTWDINYRMGGWLLNRIPVIKIFKWREVFGFRGMWGHLSRKNNPEVNRDMMVFPENTYSLSRTPYMEYSVGIENIFQFFRIDYVRRINYLDNFGIDKSGFRISFDMSF